MNYAISWAFNKPADRDMKLETSRVLGTSFVLFYYSSLNWTRAQVYDSLIYPVSMSSVFLPVSNFLAGH